MTQADLDRAVAQCTGESIAEIRSRGFTLTSADDALFDPEPICPPTYVDWDEVDAGRCSLLAG